MVSFFVCCCCCCCCRFYLSIKMRINEQMLLNNLIEHFLFLAWLVTCDKRLPEHYRWASPTSWTLAGLGKPDKLKSKEMIFENRWLQARLLPFRTTHPLASVKAWILVCFCSIQAIIIIDGRLYTSFLSYSVSLNTAGEISSAELWCKFRKKAN